MDSDVISIFTSTDPPLFWDNKTFLHENMGDYLMDEYHACLMGGAPALWDSGLGHYVVRYDAWAKAIIDTTGGTRTSNRNEVSEYLKLRAPSLDPCSMPQYIAVANGIVNPFEDGFGELDEQGQIVGFYLNGPDIPICNVLPAYFDPNAYDETTDKWLDSYCDGDEGMRVNLEEVFALCIYRGADVQQSVWCLGEGGNGKSTFLNVVERFVGIDNCSSIDMDDLAGKFNLPEMVGKLANIGDDQLVTKIDAKSCKVFKKAVVGSELEVEQKHQPRYKVRPYCSFVFSLNKFPQLADTSDGMLDRLHVINFSKRFRFTGEQINRMEDVLDNDQSRSYLLNLALKRLPDLVKRGGLTPTKFSIRQRREIELDSNSVSSFAHECLTFEHVVNCERDYLYSQYLSFCETWGFAAPVTPRTFSQRIGRIFNVVAKHDGQRVNGIQMTVFRPK